MTKEQRAKLRNVRVVLREMIVWLSELNQTRSRVAKLRACQAAAAAVDEMIGADAEKKSS